MEGHVRISEASRRLGVSSQYLRLLEWHGIIPPVRRDYSGRLYSELDIALLRAMGVGTRPRRLKRPEDVLGAVK
jgi:DNA-binding transcriptional MerR regulator